MLFYRKKKRYLVVQNNNISHRVCEKEEPKLLNERNASKMASEARKTRITWEKMGNYHLNRLNKSPNIKDGANDLPLKCSNSTQTKAHRWKNEFDKRNNILGNITIESVLFGSRGLGVCQITLKPSIPAIEQQEDGGD